MGWATLYGVKLSREQLEQRRLAAGRDLSRGMKQADVARKYRVSTASVARWANALRQGGLEALKMRDLPGAEPKLDDGQRRRLVGILLEGPRAHGWSTDLWTTKRVATLIEREFGVAYHFNYMGRLLASLGFSWQKPRRRAREKDEERKATWLRTTWRRVRKN